MKKPMIDTLLVKLSKTTTDAVGNGLRGAFVISAIESYSRQVIANAQASGLTNPQWSCFSMMINEEAWVKCAKECLELIEKALQE